MSSLAGKPCSAQWPSWSSLRLNCRPSSSRWAIRTSCATRLAHRSGTARTWSRRSALGPSPTITSWANSTGAKPLQRPSRLPILSGISSAARALVSISKRYSATSGTNCRPTLTYNAVSTKNRAHIPRPRRIRTVITRVSPPISKDPHWQLAQPCSHREDQGLLIRHA